LSETADTALVSVFRDEWPRLIGAALRIVGDLQSAEDVVQETLLTALDRWPLQGVPDSPGAWLMTACRNRARNVVRDTGRARQRLASMRPAENDWQAPEPGHGLIADDRLRLIVMCCDPLLTADGQVALTLRMVGGLTTEEIARAFHLPAAAIAQRIVRTKRVLKQHRADFLSENVDIGGRLPAVLDVIYLAFNEGYLAAGGETLTRGDLAFEAYRLACLLTDLAPDEPEPWALRALLSFQLSRWATRTDADGELLTLDAQDRGKWNRELISDGTRALSRARGGQRGPLLLQAELAACHATAPAFEETDWAAIVALYDELTAIQDTPVVALNRAVAISMLHGPGAGIAALSALTSDPALRSSHRVWAVRADLHRRLADNKAAIADYDKALHLVTNDAERRYLTAARCRLAEETTMPTFRKSSPELVARFDELALLAGDADRKQIFGYPACMLAGNMFMGLHENTLILRLPESDRAEFADRHGAAVFEPMPGRPMKEYVVVPPALVYDDGVSEWVRRSRAYAEQLPAKKPRKKD
jgi:RNA polymerase sigma factor (sigma-70 family)